MDRIDKIVSNSTKYSRSEVKKLIKANKIKVNDIVIDKPEFKVDIENDSIIVNGESLTFKKNIYLVLNKPKGYISATEDRESTVLDLVSKDYGDRKLFPVGRLDKDTTGLIILTDDGDFAHNIVSPKKDHKKIYRVTIDIPITDEMIEEFKNGVVLIDSKCKPAKLEKIENNIALVTLTEGKYHQIKRMFGCFKAKVIELERIQIGNFKLPRELNLGEYRELSDDELKMISDFK
ncbi:MAG: rRNA pseudouridine synthase [Clostridia bacterium]|nr:rRNA pseudouridine synthase [Clostridia bacterium]